VVFQAGRGALERQGAVVQRRRERNVQVVAERWVGVPN
jgi:hypothetical protein